MRKRTRDAFLKATSNLAHVVIGSSYHPDCPLCAAGARTAKGGPSEEAEMQRFFPRADGKPPVGMEDALLVRDALETYGEIAGQPGKELEFITTETLDGNRALRSAYSVDSQGVIYWTLGGKRTLIGRLDVRAEPEVSPVRRT